MTREALIQMGLSEEHADKVMASLDGSFVTKDRFNAVNDEVKQLRTTVKERDTQLEGLKKATGDTEALQKQITDLQAANKTQAQQHAQELQQLRLDAAVDKALTGAKARNPATVRPLLQLDKAELLEDGTIKGLGDQLKQLAEAEDTKFLFQADAPPKPSIHGLVPGEKRDGSLPKGAADMGYEELCAFLEAGGTLNG